MKDFRITIETHDTVNLLRLSGALDMYSFPKLESQLNGLFHLEKYNVVLDCENLSYIGSAGLGPLIGFAKQAREHGGDVVLLNVPPRILEIIELLGATKVLPVVTNQQDALARFATH